MYVLGGTLVDQSTNVPPSSDLTDCSDLTEQTSTLICNSVVELPDEPEFDSCSSIDSLSDNDSDFLPNIPTNKSSLNKLNIRRAAQEADRYNISNRAAAALITAAFKDGHLIHSGNSDLVFDANKLRRQRIKAGLQAVKKNNFDVDVIRSIYFDGKKSDTLVKECVSLVKTNNSPATLSRISQSRTATRKEEHYVILVQPGDRYLTHTSPNSSTAVSIADSILQVLKNYANDLVAIGADATPTNTGANGGIIRLIEKYLNKPLHWFICLLHMNELPFRHLFLQLDGKTNGPDAFSGIIGKAIAGELHKTPMAKFRRVNTNVMTLPDDIIKDLSNDQKYLYNMCIAISNG